jgi:Domain of unknown function (DUF3427)/HNH endonuclease
LVPFLWQNRVKIPFAGSRVLNKLVCCSSNQPMFIVNKQYTKKDIYEILKVPEKSRKGAWDTGYRRYGSDIYLFANIDSAGRTGVNHHNRWDRGDLVWFSKPTANTAQPMMQQMLNRETKIHIFARGDSRDAFTYYGTGYAVDHHGQEPVSVRWRLRQNPTINAPKAWQQFSEGKRKRDSADPDGKIDEGVFAEAIEKINQSGGTVPRGSLLNSRDLEMTFVWYLPMLDFDNEGKQIVVVEADDDTDVKDTSGRRRPRRGQNKLKQNLLKIYGGKCCVTGTAVVETLRACHITAHVISGINHSTNGLLLRSDIHDLFDEGLLGIDPESLRVRIKMGLRDTIYFKYDGKQLLARRDGVKPNVAALKQRWKLFLNVQR